MSMNTTTTPTEQDNLRTGRDRKLEYQRRYQQSEKGKATVKKYLTSEKGKAAIARHIERTRKKRGSVTKGNVKCISCGAIANRRDPTEMLGWLNKKPLSAHRGVCPTCRDITLPGA